MAQSKIRKEDALEYHKRGNPGKVEVIPTKDSKTQRDLALAYSPGVAFPCLEIAEKTENVYDYTAKGNLVAVISDGSAVLGLGDIGPEASKPVMEGKGILFKIFAGIDVFDLELDTKNTEEFISVVKALEPTFGGINLEDIKAPECFEIESRLKKEMNIPVMHDDQHGTAIISGAALINAVEVVDKKMSDIKVVVSGAGASAISCIKIIIELGVKKENIIVCDSKGVIRTDRENLSGFKKDYATEINVNSLEEALVGCDFFLGLSKANVMTPEMLLSMAKDPIVFALANPNPEIDYNLAMETRKDVIVATGRSDFPNQVNNVLGFPFIFRGALDVRATEINEAMKLAAVKAIATLAKAPVPDIVMHAYNLNNISFGRKYIIPKPFDPRLLTTVTPAVAKAAIESGIAKKVITDWDDYEGELIRRMGNDDNLLRVVTNRAKQKAKKIVFAEADDHRILKAAQIAQEEGIAEPILLGNRNKIKEIMEAHHIKMDNVQIIDPRSADTKPIREKYAEIFYKKRQRRGYNWLEAKEKIKSRNYFGTMMVQNGEADAIISGISRNYANTIKPALEIIGTYAPGKKVSSMYLMITKRGPLFFADTTILPNPTVEELIDITRLTANAVRKGFDIEPKVALVSYSNFGSSDDEEPRKMRKAVEILKETYPNLVVDGEIQANFALNQDALKENFPFSGLVENSPNILIFPNLSAANISYKLMQTMGASEAVGPIILGMKKPVHILQMGSSVRETLNMISIANIDAQNREV